MKEKISASWKLLSIVVLTFAIAVNSALAESVRDSGSNVGEENTASSEQVAFQNYLDAANLVLNNAREKCHPLTILDHNLLVFRTVYQTLPQQKLTPFINALGLLVQKTCAQIREDPELSRIIAISITVFAPVSSLIGFDDNSIDIEAHGLEEFDLVIRPFFRNDKGSVIPVEVDLTGNPNEPPSDFNLFYGLIERVLARHKEILDVIIPYEDYRINPFR